MKQNGDDESTEGSQKSRNTPSKAKEKNCKIKIGRKRRQKEGSLGIMGGQQTHQVQERLSDELDCGLMKKQAI